MKYVFVEETFSSYGRWFDHVVQNLGECVWAEDNKLVNDAGALVACWDADQDSGWVCYGKIKSSKTH